MSKIVVTSENIDKFVKRFHKNAGKELNKSLSESRELFAKSLGVKNYNELQIILKENVKKETDRTQNLMLNYQLKNKYDQNLINNKGYCLKILNEEFDEIVKIEETYKNNLSIEELFYNRLMCVLNFNESKISFAVIEEIEKFEYRLLFKTIYGDFYEHHFGSSEKNILLDEIYIGINSGLSIFDSLCLNFTFSILSDFKSKFFFKELGHNLFNMLKKTGENRSGYILKFDKDAETNKDIKFINDEIFYNLSKGYIKHDDYFNIDKLTKKIKYKNEDYYIFENKIYNKNEIILEMNNYQEIYYYKSEYNKNDFNLITLKPQ